QTPAVQPARNRLIVDAQVHLWKAESPDWPWVPGMKPQMPEPFTIEKLVPLMDEAGVDRAVIVPPSWPGDRNDYGIEAAKRYPNRFAVMGRIPLKNPESAVLLPRWKEQPGMLGVRVTFLGPAAAWLTDGIADWFWPAAEKAGLPRHVPEPGAGGGNCSHRGTPPAAHTDRRSHGGKCGCRKSRQAGGFDRPDSLACQISECFRQAVSGAQQFDGSLSVPRFYSAHPAPVRRLRSAALLLGD